MVERFSYQRPWYRHRRRTGVSKIVENNRKEEAQRVTAIMVIDDMEQYNRRLQESDEHIRYRDGRIQKMKDITIYTLTSPLHDEQSVTASTHLFLSSLGIDYDMCGSDFSTYGQSILDLIYVRTGGTENIFRQLLPQIQSSGKPVLLQCPDDPAPDETVCPAPSAGYGDAARGNEPPAALGPRPRPHTARSPHHCRPGRQPRHTGYSPHRSHQLPQSRPRWLGRMMDINKQNT